MKRINVVFSFILLLSSSGLFAQESTQQKQAAPDSAKLDSTAQIDPSLALPETGGSKSRVQKEKGQTEGQSFLSKIVIGVIVAFFTAFFAWLFARLPRPLFNKNERRYRKTLRKEPGQIKLVGPGMDDISMRLYRQYLQRPVRE